ncbi:unnamed protein product [Merluccius merluccius]
MVLPGEGALDCVITEGQRKRDRREEPSDDGTPARVRAQKREEAGQETRRVAARKDTGSQQRGQRDPIA